MTSDSPRRRLSFFPATEAQHLEDTDFMTIAPDSAPVPAEIMDRWAPAANEGAQLKVLVRDASGFSLIHVWFKPNYQLPRHSHSADCLYYVISGSARMGNRQLGPGDSFFVPRGAPYGYSSGPDGVEVLEIRYGTSQFDISLSQHTLQAWTAMASSGEHQLSDWRQRQTSPTFAANTASHSDMNDPQ